MKEMRNVYKILFGTLEVKRSLGGPRSVWEDNIKLDLEEMGV
jgi:hypothetical protein